MSHFLYISDVFCPWCYGFAPVMQRISSEHPGYPVRVLSGDLVENPTTTGEMMRNHPTMREFFVRLAKTTGQAVGQDFLRRLEPGQGDLRMFSPDMAVPLAALKKLTLIVGFNRRFAPLYGELKTQLATAASLRMDKHRSNSVGPHDLYFTLLDDYLHVVDTALWLSGGKASLDGGTLLTNDAGEMLFAEHHFSAGPLQITTCMHRRAGSQRETVQAVTDGALIDITDMREWREERGQGVVHKPIPGWQSTLEQRGFVGCARHFIECVQNQTVPQTAGEQAVLAQRIVDKIWRDAMSE